MRRAVSNSCILQQESTQKIVILQKKKKTKESMEEEKVGDTTMEALEKKGVDELSLVLARHNKSAGKKKDT